MTTRRATKAASNNEARYEAVQGQPVAPPAQAKFFVNSADVWTDCRSVAAEEKREFFMVYFLDVRHRLIGERWTMAIGSLTEVEVHPRDIFHEAIKRAASALICVHNHPSGDPQPSRQDIELTRRLCEVGELCGIAVLDHVVVAEAGFVSLDARGWC